MRIGPWRKSNAEELMLLNCGAEEGSWESLGPQGYQTNQSSRKSTLNIHWNDWCWSSNTLATWYKELACWERSWCWERLKATGEEGGRGWVGWMASLIQWTRVWANSVRWWLTGKPGVLQSMGSQRVGHDWASKPNWTTTYFNCGRENSYILIKNTVFREKPIKGAPNL